MHNNFRAKTNRILKSKRFHAETRKNIQRITIFEPKLRLFDCLSDFRCVFYSKREAAWQSQVKVISKLFPTSRLSQKRLPQHQLLHHRQRPPPLPTLQVSHKKYWKLFGQFAHISTLIWNSVRFMTIQKNIVDRLCLLLFSN